MAGAAYDPQMSRYSAFAILRHGLTGNRSWPRVWREPEPKSSYDVVIVGAGGHGLATAFYLAQNHGIRKVAVIEKGYLGSGNVGRNTTIVRSNYMMDGNTQFYEHSLKLWEGLSHALNYNVMFSQRGHIILGHSPDAMESLARRANTMRLNGIDSELLGWDAVRKLIPHLNYGPEARYQIYGGLLQPRAGTARHDAVAWGYARAADRLGVDIIQNCEVTGFLRQGDRVTGVETARGPIAAGKVGLAVAGSTTTLTEKLGLRLPIESHILQAFVTEPVKPLLDFVVVNGHLYMSQSDKGGMVFGAHIEQYNSYAQRGNLPRIQEVMQTAIATLPAISRLRIVRHWGGIMDQTPDGSPIIAPTPLEGFYLNCGWNYGGFKATPASGWCFAHTIAEGTPHRFNAPFTIDRFAEGRQIDEHGYGPYNFRQ